MSTVIINKDARTNKINKILDNESKITSSLKGNIIRSRKIVKALTFNSTKSGKFTILRYYVGEDNRSYYDIRFVNTGYIVKDLRIGQIMTGEIKDFLCPVVHGVGFLGEKYTEYRKEDPELYKCMYHRWTNMLRRCYNNKSNQYRIYGEKGVSVSKRWHNFSNYYHDIQKLDGFNRELVINGELTLDKDKLQKGAKHKVYSRETCCWLTPAEQNLYVNHDEAQDSLKRYYRCLTPDAKVVIGKGIGKFARLHNLDPGDCSRCLNEIVDHVKGYKFYHATKKEINKYNSLNNENGYIVIE